MSLVTSVKYSLTAEALKERSKKEKKKKLDELLVEGYKATKGKDKKLNKEWEKITLKGWM